MKMTMTMKMTNFKIIVYERAPYSTIRNVTWMNCYWRMMMRMKMTNFKIIDYERAF